MLALILVAVSLGMSNFAGALAIGLAGVDARLRLRVALAFGLIRWHSATSLNSAASMRQPSVDCRSTVGRVGVPRQNRR